MSELWGSTAMDLQFCAPPRGGVLLTQVVPPSMERMTLTGWPPPGAMPARTTLGEVGEALTSWTSPPKGPRGAQVPGVRVEGALVAAGVREDWTMPPRARRPWLSVWDWGVWARAMGAAAVMAA